MDEKTELPINLKKYISNARNYKIFMMPHSMTWEKLIICVIVFQVCLVPIYLTFFPNTLVADLEVTYYIFEIFYAMDLLFHILHRNFSIHKTDLCIKKVPFFILLIGLISIIPYHEAYDYLIFAESSVNLKHICKLKVIIRLLHVIWYFITKSHESGINRIAVVFFQSLTVNFLFTCFVACYFEYISCFGCIYDNWTTHLRETNYDVNDFFDRLLFPYTFVAGILYGNYSGILMPETGMELFCVLMILIFGFIIKVNLILAQLTCEYISKNWRKYSYTARCDMIKDYLQNEEISKELLALILEYYKVLWIKRTAIVKRPSGFDILPLGLQKEIELDLNWDAINHSHLFRNQSKHFKRHLSMIIQSEFRLKGDSVYDSGELKTKFIYIVSGLVQLLSDEDDESPVVSFSSGTVISELACLMITRSEGKLRCATYCEFKVLHLNDFYKQMYTYKDLLLEFQKQTRDRIDSAIYFQKCKKKDVSSATQGLRPLRKVKLHWYSLLNKKMVATYSNTCNYMDLIALSDDIELKVEVVCLTSTFPLILDPDSSFLKFLEKAFVVGSALHALLVPYFAAFRRSITSEWRTFFMFIDILYIFDIYIQVTTAVKDNDIVIIKFPLILMHRIRQLSFLIDICATFPLDYLMLLRGADPHTYIVCKLLRLLKIYKLMKLVQVSEKRLTVNMLYTMIVKYYLLLIIMVYISMCIFYMESCYFETCTPTSWFLTNFKLMETASDIIHPAIYTVVFVTNILNRGIGIIYFYNANDGLTFLFLIIIGYYIYMFCLAQMTAVAYWNLHEETSFKMFINSMMNYARIHNIPGTIYYRISNLLTFRWSHTHNLLHVDAREFYDELPTNIQNKLDEELLLKHLEVLPFFDLLQDDTKKRLCKMALMIGYPSQAFLCMNNQIIDHIYIIKQGYAECISIVPGDEEQLTNKWFYKRGDCFPYLEVLHQVPCFLTVKAVTAVSAIVIPYEKFWQAIKMDSKCFKILSATLEAHMARHNLTLNRNLTRMNFQVEQKAYKGYNYFKYELLDPTDNSETKDAGPLWSRTINPHSKFYITYEAIHCTLVTLQFILLILEFNVLFDYYRILRIVYIFLDIISWIDIVIRSRVQYYDHNGIMVKDHRSTTKHYLNTAFAVDFYSSCPIPTLSIGAMIFSSTPIMAKYIILMLTRPLQLYRVLYGMWHLCSRVNVSEVNIIRLQFILIVAILVSLFANIMVLLTCNVENDAFECSTIAWRGSDIKEITRDNYLMLYSYFAVEYLSASPKNIYAEISNWNYMIYLGLTFVSVGIYFFLTSKLTSLGLHGEYMTAQLQNDRLNFRNFSKQDSLDSNIQSKVIKTNEYLTKDTESYAQEEADKRFTPQLRADVAFILNCAALKASELLHNVPDYFINVLTKNVTREFCMKDCIIIRPNNINSKIYIIKVGNVDIFLAGYKMTSLGPGGMFGSFTRKERKRQTIEAVASMHTEVLSMDSITFCQICQTNAYVKKHLDLYINRNTEFIAEHIRDKAPTLTAKLSEITTAEVQYRRIFRTINKIFNQNKKYYLLMTYILDVHLSVISATCVMIFQYLSINDQPREGLKAFLYLCDAIFHMKIFWGFCLNYVDEVSGLVVNDQKKIIIRYVKSRFIVDLISVAMPELYFGGFITNASFRSVLRSNRLVRFFYLYRHYSYHRKHNKLTHHLRWTFLVYTTILYVQFFSNLWNLVACNPDLCRIRRFISHDPEQYVYASNSLVSYLISYVNVVNTFTGSGMHLMKPLDISEIVITFLIVTSTIFTITLIYSGYIFIQLIDNYNLGQYNHRLEEIKLYLHQQRLSPAILDKVMFYYYFIWKVQKGEQWPRLIKYTDQFIKEDINLDIYYEHLYHHPVLKTTHTDFLRQLSVYLRRCIYPTSFVIANEGDIDGRMYFIHRGVVGCFKEEKNELNEVGTLSKNNSFGELTGFANEGHEFTYIAKTFVVILSLNLNDWKYLLKFFPATVENIKQQLMEHYGFDYKC